jgi:hypothetical protein
MVIMNLVTADGLLGKNKLTTGDLDMIPLPHQIKFASLAFTILKRLGYVYIAGKPRSGKTYTALLICEMSDKINRVLVLTKKNAIPGWHKFTLDNKRLKHSYYITNYEQVAKLKSEDYDAVIIDESHNTGAFPRPSLRYKQIRKLCWDMPHIHLSGTAIVESPSSIYHQMFISKYTPFKHKNFYDFHREFGEPYYIKAAGREINQYDRVKDSLIPYINQFTIYIKQEDAGIDKSIQAIDKIHIVDLNQGTKELYNTLQTDQVAKVYYMMFSERMLKVSENLEQQLVCDSTMKLRTSLHMLESGVAKIGEQYIDLGNREKINYIKDNFGDSEDTGIMCHFVGERQILEKEFKHAKIYSSSSDAEGVDLSHLRNFIILSSDYSGSKFIQRRDRIININGSNTLTVHHIMVKNAISEQVYKKVSKKEDFNNSTYEVLDV